MGPDPIIKIFLMSLRFGIRFSWVPFDITNRNCHPERSRGTCFPWVGWKPIGSEVDPRWVARLNQLRPLLSRYRGADVIESLEVYETVDAIFSRKTRYSPFSVLSDPRHQIVCYSRIQNMRAAR